MPPIWSWSWGQPAWNCSNFKSTTPPDRAWSGSGQPLNGAWWWTSWHEVTTVRNRFQAIALEYGRHKAPRVSAKGHGDLARLILAEAEKQGVFVSQDPQLLSLLSRLEVGDEIPQDMYTAVAVILSWVYWLKGMEPGDEKLEPAPQASL
ncbi:MAG: hypothetical protein EBQ82_04060 [Betaproteobacteria bacterium]|nr:hypothetical protein [Betaproteobacteria bacterium]NBY04579.1 hypothetical protein [Betaproteobacteria bacterium]